MAAGKIVRTIVEGGLYAGHCCHRIRIDDPQANWFLTEQFGQFSSPRIQIEVPHTSIPPGSALADEIVSLRLRLPETPILVECWESVPDRWVQCANHVAYHASPESDYMGVPANELIWHLRPESLTLPFSFAQKKYVMMEPGMSATTDIAKTILTLLETNPDWAVRPSAVLWRKEP